MGTAKSFQANDKKFLLNSLSFLLVIPWGMWNFPNQGWNPCPLQWNCSILTIGPPGKFKSSIIFKVALHLYITTISKNIHAYV